MTEDELYMREALKLAKKAFDAPFYKPKSDELVKQKGVQQEITRLKPKYTKEKHTENMKAKDNRVKSQDFFLICP